MNAIAARAIEAMDFLVDAVEQIPSESWDQPSNLDGWSIRDLVVHTTGSAAKLVALAGGDTSEATDDLQQLAARLKDALASKDPDTVAELSHCRPDHSRLGRVPSRSISRSRFPTTCWRFAVRWWRRCRKTSCVGRACSDRPSRHPTMRRRPPDSWPTSGARPRAQMRTAVV